MNPGLGQQVTDRPAAGIIECLERVWRDVGLRIDKADIVLGRPADAILERQPAAKVNADPVLECHAGHRFLPKSPASCVMAAGISVR